MRVLCVEDAPDSAAVIAEVLAHGGYEPVIAATGKQGLEAARDPAIAAILIDDALPDMNGCDVVRALRAQGRTIPIIAVTADASDRQVMRCLDAGCSYFIAKPPAPRELLGWLREGMNAAQENHKR